MDELEHALASAALESSSESGHVAAAPEPGASSPPFLPPELIADIIELAVELLIEEERHLETHATLSNRFLLSASLVNRTWHSITTKTLLSRGIVTSSFVPYFLLQVRRHRMTQTLESVRFGEASGGVAPEDAGGEDLAFNVLVFLLPGLKSVEIVESGGYFETRLPPGRSIQRVHLANFNIFKDGFGRKFEISPPTYLSITDTRENLRVPFGGPARPVEPLIWFLNVIKDVPNLGFKVYHKSGSGFQYLRSIMSLADESLQTQSAALRSCTFQCESSESWTEVHFRMSLDGLQPYSYPFLEHLATHLFLARFLLIRTTQPSLKSLDILPDPYGTHKSIDDLVSHIYSHAPETALLELIHALPVLEDLKVPACWRSDAVEDACEAKGVSMIWTQVALSASFDGRERRL